MKPGEDKDKIIDAKEGDEQDLARPLIIRDAEERDQQFKEAGGEGQINAVRQNPLRPPNPIQDAKEGDEQDLARPLIIQDAEERNQQFKEARGEGQSNAERQNPLQPPNPIQVQVVEPKKKKISEMVSDIWRIMNWLLLSEIGILGALYSTPHPGKCQFWWIIFGLILLLSLLCIARLMLAFHLLYKEMKDGDEALEGTHWLRTSPWRFYALICCTMGTLVVNTVFLSIASKLVPCWVKKD